MREHLIAWLYGLGWAVTGRLPRRPADLLFRTMADLTWRRHGPAVRQLESNLARVTGAPADGAEVRSLSRAALRSYFRYWREFFSLRTWRPEHILDLVRIDSLAPIRDALSQNRGVIVALSHSGNWDLAGAALVRLGHPFTTVAQRQRPESLHRRFVRHRTALGIEVLLADDTRRTVTTLTARLRDGAVVCLLADRDVSASGTRVLFFGRTTTMPGGPAHLALRTGAALIPVASWYDGPVLRVRVHPEIPAPGVGSSRERAARMTQELADVFEAEIRAHPQDWHVLQPVWEPPSH
ncbi:phosphatidylinositol mannoside acyltransferase [Actinoplanes sp. NPDC051346]|uniref:phosphatidylinositol mannoside acyltransferase n=1 Tax=Actinoplanes sp. NPDC051346 TaxID=3155048 RepID=UPI00343318AE